MVSKSSCRDSRTIAAEWMSCEPQEVVVEVFGADEIFFSRNRSSSSPPAAASCGVGTHEVFSQKNGFAEA